MVNNMANINVNNMVNDSSSVDKPDPKVMPALPAERHPPSIGTVVV